MRSITDALSMPLVKEVKGQGHMSPSDRCGGDIVVDAVSQIAVGVLCS